MMVVRLGERLVGSWVGWSAGCLVDLLVVVLVVVLVDLLGDCLAVLTVEKLASRQVGHSADQRAARLVLLRVWASERMLEPQMGLLLEI